jgi:NADH:ubiquinone oxidoreductase subunit 5 (subunit L)/multisubunit Na+/H+ antiporter MnhA subunit
MSAQTLLIFLAVPFLAAALMPLIPKKAKRLQSALLLTATVAALTLAGLLFGQSIDWAKPWLSWGSFTIDFALRLDSFSGFIVLAASAFALLIAVYATVFMKGHGSSRSFFAYMLLTLGLINGAVLANNLLLMLFFWEGLLVTLFTMILTGGVKASGTALKALVLNGVADLCLMLGIAVLAGTAHTLAMDQISCALEGSSAGTLAFILMMIGATAKAGAMPFHTWIPDAALDAPLPFMAFLPAALEKLAGIYLLARISLNLFQFRPGSAMSLLMMILGAVTLLFAVLMALIQKDYKRLLSYHAVSQVGYMILGIGTALPIGIVGGLFHMINHAMYKSTLFLTAGSVERQAGTTDLKKLGGMGRRMPVTFVCFIVAAAAISGVPPFNGFFSKELIFGATLETNVVFYIVAALGAFFTAASFLKLGHAVFLGKPGEKAANVKEAPWPMLAPMIVIAAGCLLFGVWNALPLQKFIEPILGARLEGETFAGHMDWLLTAISLGILALAFLNHRYGVKRSGSGLGASDHFHHAPGLRQMYDLAERRRFDPYEIGMTIANGAAAMLLRLDRGIDWLFSTLTVRLTDIASQGIRKAHTGSYWMYILWILGGLAAIAALAAALA